MSADQIFHATLSLHFAFYRNYAKSLKIFLFVLYGLTQRSLLWLFLEF